MTDSTREMRRQGVRKKNGKKTKLSSQFLDFLHDSKNKEMFNLHNEMVADNDIPITKKGHITCGKTVISKNSIREMSDCDHEEAD